MIRVLDQMHLRELLTSKGYCAAHPFHSMSSFEDRIIVIARYSSLVRFSGSLLASR